MTTLTDSTGGFLIAEEVAAMFYNNFRAQTIRGKLGVTEVTPGGIPFRMNKKTGNTTAYRRGETSSVAASDIAFGQRRLRQVAPSPRPHAATQRVQGRMAVKGQAACAGGASCCS